MRPDLISLILLVIKLQQTSPIPLMREYQSTFKPAHSVDWHDFSNALETMTCGKLTEYVTGHSGRDIHNHHVYRLRPDWAEHLTSFIQQTKGE